MSPQTKRSRPGSSKRAQAARAICAERLEISKARSARPYSARTSGVDPNELVSTTSQPARR
jgi:hypothetical protein